MKEDTKDIHETKKSFFSYTSLNEMNERTNEMSNIYEQRNRE
jgi:hypothetical protein